MTAQTQDVEKEVIAIIAEKACVGPETITPQTHLTVDLNFDSLDKVEMVMNLEEHFETEIPDEDTDGIETVGQILAYVNKRLGQ